MKYLKWIIPVLIIIFCFLGFLIAPHNPETIDVINKYVPLVRSSLWEQINLDVVNYHGYYMADG